MPNRFKLKLPSFQICRSKTNADYTNPKAISAIYKVSPFNPKSFDISFPNLPDPPPSTPDCPSNKHRRCGSDRRSTLSLAQCLADCSIESPGFARNKDENQQIRLQARNHRRFMQQSLSFSEDSIDNISPVIVAEDYCSCICSGEVDNDEAENGIETETLLFSSRSFSCDSSFDFCNLPAAMETLTKKSAETGKYYQKTSKKRIRKLKRHLSKKNSWKSYSSSSMEISSPIRASVLRRMISCTTDGKVEESVAVVKKSVDPYVDFKRSMLEMILEKQIFEAKGLEELLQCFLSLNSRQYHGVIVEAFSEIWDILFCDSTVKKNLSSMPVIGFPASGRAN